MYRAKAKSLQTVYKGCFQYMSLNMIWEMFVSLQYKRLKRDYKKMHFYCTSPIIEQR